MLTEDRQNRIVELVNNQGSVTTIELMEKFEASESTIRRDLGTLDKTGKLSKVHGGAIANDKELLTTDDRVELRKERNIDEKHLIGKYAAKLIEDGDFVYLDAGTTTEVMIEYIKAKNVCFVTNAIEHARKLSNAGYTAYLLGGQFKSVTSAIVGEEAVTSLQKYNFTKGFFGTNGITVNQGATTPEIKEALVKRKAMESSAKTYILADNTKFDQVSAITFASFEDATIITDKAKAEYRDMKNVVEVKEA